jgi:hypothetical protein
MPRKKSSSRFIPGTKIEVMGMVQRELQKIILKPGKQWKYATTVIREENAWRLGSAFFARDEENTLISPSWAYPEKREIIPYEKLKPKVKEK